MSNLQEFIDYVWAFYNPQSELYPIKGLTKKDILEDTVLDIEEDVVSDTVTYQIYQQLIHLKGGNSND